MLLGGFFNMLWVWCFFQIAWLRTQCAMLFCLLIGRKVSNSYTFSECSARIVKIKKKDTADRRGKHFALMFVYTCACINVCIYTCMCICARIISVCKFAVDPLKGLCQKVKKTDRQGTGTSTGLYGATIAPRQRGSGASRPMTLRGTCQTLKSSWGRCHLIQNIKKKKTLVYVNIFSLKFCHCYSSYYRCVWGRYLISSCFVIFAQFLFPNGFRNATLPLADWSPFAVQCDSTGLVC